MTSANYYGKEPKGQMTNKPTIVDDSNLDAVMRGHLVAMARKTPDEATISLRRNGPESEWPEWPVEGPIEWVPEVLSEANPFLLGLLALEDLGAPEGSVDYETISVGQSWKTKRNNPMDDAWVQDYEELGWPKSAGPSVRYVTREEHCEIMKRLRASGLTLPGSEVLNVSQTLQEIVEAEVDTPEWLIEGILRRGGAAMVFGPAGVGKTWLVHTLTLMVAHGGGLAIGGGGEEPNTAGAGPEASKAVLKAGEHQGARVLVVDGEMILADIAERAKVLSEALGLGTDQAKEALERVTVYAKADQDHRGAFVDLAAPEWTARIIEEAQAKRYDVIVLDNLSTLNPTLADENSAVAWNPLNNLIVALKGAGIAVVIVHHAGKGGGYRGSSALATTLETIVNLEKVSDDEVCADARFRVVIEKSRAHGVPEVHGKTLRLTGGAWVVEVDELGEAARVVRMVRSLKYGSQRELAGAMGVEPMKVSRILNKGTALGLCTKDEIREWLKKAKDAREFVGDPEEYGDGNPLSI